MFQFAFHEIQKCVHTRIQPVSNVMRPAVFAGFDDFVEKNSSYSLSPATIAGNLDKDFDTLHPKQLRRIVLGPFYSAGITEHNSVVAEVLSKVRKPENGWLLTWTPRALADGRLP